MSNTINPNSPSTLPPTTNTVDSANPPTPADTVAQWETKLSDSPELISSFEKMLLEKKVGNAVHDARASGQDISAAMGAAQNDPTYRRLHDTVSEYEAGNATLHELAVAFADMDASLQKNV